MAEFWNSISNAAFILLSLHGIYYCLRHEHEKQLLLCHLGILIVGVGSWAFHATLRYEFQLLDELPMIYSTCMMVYALYVALFPLELSLSLSLSMWTKHMYISLCVCVPP